MAFQEIGVVARKDGLVVFVMAVHDKGGCDPVQAPGWRGSVWSFTQDRPWGASLQVCDDG